MGIRDHYLCQIPLLKSKWSVLPTLKGRGFDHTQAWSLSIILEFCLPQNLSSDPFIWLGLLPLVSLYRILCSFWRVIFQKQVSLPHRHCAQILSLLFRSVGKGGDRRFSPSYFSNFLFLLLLSPRRKSKKMQYRTLTINSKSAQMTWNYRREGHLTQGNFSAEISPSRRSFCPRGDHRGGLANKVLQT